MRKAIYKAIENGWGTTHEVTRGDIPLKYDAFVYFIIFGTDFIDKLVGDIDCVNRVSGEKCKDYYNETFCLECEPLDADYHRSKMANIKDLKKLEEYVRVLV